MEDFSEERLGMSEMEMRFWMVCVTHMFLEVYFLIQVALIPVFIREFSLSLIEASFVATIPSLFQLLMNLPAGFLADRINAKYLLFTSMVVEGLSALAISQTNNFWLLVLGVSAMRISSAIYHISGLTLISRLVKQDRMNRSMGSHNALGSLGAAIGLLSLSIFLLTTGWRMIYIFWSVPLLVWGFVLLRSPQFQTSGTERSKSEKRESLGRLPLVFSTAFLTFLVAIGLREVGNTGTSTFMTTYLVTKRGLSEATASLIFGLGPFMGIAGSLNSGYLGEKMGAKRTLDILMLGCILSLTILAGSAQLPLLVLGYLLYAFFSNSVWSPLNTMVADLTQAEDRGLSFSVYFLTEGLIVSITPPIAATIVGFTDMWYIFPFSIVFLAACLIVFQPLFHLRR